MKIRELQFRGFFEEQSFQTAERVQIIVPENDMEQNLLSWAILAHGETVKDDPDRPNHTFYYTVGRYLGDGMYLLRIRSRHETGRELTSEIVAAMVAVTSAVEGRYVSFEPFWFISDDLHMSGRRASEFDRPSFGRLVVGSDSILPHRRLFAQAAA